MDPHPPTPKVESNKFSRLEEIESVTAASGRLVSGGENPRVQLVSRWSNIGDEVNGPITGVRSGGVERLQGLTETVG